MKPFECFQMYLAIKQHFSNSSYDYFKYAGKIKTSVDLFEKRRDRHFFTKLLNKYPDPKMYLVANFVANPSFWIGDVTDPVTDQIYLHQQKILQSLDYTMKNQLKPLVEQSGSVKQLIRYTENKHPDLLCYFIANKVSFEVLTIFLFSSRTIEYWDKEMAADPYWKTISLMMHRWYPFIPLDREKVRQTALKAVDLC